MTSTIPKKALVALPDFENKTHRIVSPEEATVSYFDRSFHFGDSLYEVARTYEGVPFALEEHLIRLKKSADLAQFEAPIDYDQIRSLIERTCKAYFQKFGNTDVYLRITVSRGTGDLNIDRDYSSAPYTTLLVKEQKDFAPELYQKGVHYAIVERRRNSPNALNPAMKSGNYLNNILALNEAKRKWGASDAILLDQHGYVTEGTTNNVYGVKDGAVWSAPLDVGILAGITRELVSRICKEHSIEFREQAYTPLELMTCSEMFLSSATKEVMPITMLNQRKVGNGLPGPITLKLHQELRKIILNNTRTQKSLFV